MAGIGGVADLDYSLTASAELASVLSARAIGAGALSGPGDDDDDSEPAASRRRDGGDDGIEDLLDWLDLGVIVTDATARPVRLNRRAGAIIARKDGLFATPFGITTAIPEETGRLRQAIAAAPAGGTRLRLTRPSGAAPLLVTVIPVRGGDPDRDRRAWVALFVMDPDIAGVPSPALLQELFGLTAAEAVFAAEISRGDGLQAVAERLAIAPTTARTHLTRIFEKTGTRRQAELVRLLMQCDRLAPAAPVRTARISS